MSIININLFYFNIWYLKKKNTYTTYFNYILSYNKFYLKIVIKLKKNYWILV